jgi:hypothetical protein
MMLTDDSQELHEQWLRHDEGVLLMNVFSFLDVKTLLQIERFNRTRKNLCKKTIDEECGPNGPEAFHSNQEQKDVSTKLEQW